MKLFNTLAISCLLLTLNTNLHANSDEYFFNDILIFGDSLFDSGNSDGFTFTNPNSDGTPGKIAVDHFADAFNLTINPLFLSESGGNSYAVGGYTTPEILSSVIYPAGSTTGGARLLDDHRDGFTAANNKISGRTAVFLNGGGNNFLNGLITDDESIIRAAIEMKTAVGALNLAGAQHLFVANLPNIALTPSVYKNGRDNCDKLSQVVTSEACQQTIKATQDGTSAAALAYATFLASQMNSVDANIIPIDYLAMQTAVLENPAAFGFDPALGDGLYQTCYDGSGTSADCFENDVLGANSGKMPDQLLFNDGVHPTQYVQKLIGDLMADTVTGPTEIATLPQMGLQLIANQEFVIKEMMKSSRWLNGSDISSWSISLHNNSYTQDNNGYAANGMLSSQLVSLTYSNLSSRVWRTAVSFNYSNGSIDVDNNTSEYQNNGYGLSLFVGYQPNRYFIEGTTSFASLRYTNTRHINLNNNLFRANSKPIGFAWNASLDIGIDLGFKSANLTLAPVVGLSVASAQTNQFSEADFIITDYSYGELEYQSQIARVGLTGEFHLNKKSQLIADGFLGSDLVSEDVDVEVTNINSKFNSYYIPGYRSESESFLDINLGYYYQFDIGELSVNYQYNDQFSSAATLFIGFKQAL